MVVLKSCCMSTGAGTMRRRRGKAARPRAEGQQQAQQRKRHKGKPRLPQGFDPEHPPPPPDPERWLPKWQRSDFKRRRGQRRKDKVCCSLGWMMPW